jgi:outer membrane biosynthesis protein TonB
LALLLAIVVLDDRTAGGERGATTLREVQSYEPPPPPPPPPPERESARAAGPSLALANREEEIALKIMDLDVDLSGAELGSFGSGLGGPGEGAGSGIEIVSLADLDTLPIVLSAPALAYPDEAIDRGVTEFVVAIHIVIDESGRTYPVRILENPFPATNAEFLDYASQVLFSAPTRLGVPVRAEYRWPLLLKSQ